MPGGKYESVRAGRERAKYAYSPCEGTGSIIPHAYNIYPATVYLSLFRHIYTIVWQEPDCKGDPFYFPRSSDRIEDMVGAFVPTSPCKVNQISKLFQEKKSL